MEEKQNKVPFPQANDFNKILKIIEVDDEDKLLDTGFLLDYLELGTQRQISYYVSAAEFLGIIDKSRRFTIFGNELRDSIYESRVLKLCQRIVSLPVFGELFFMQYLYKEVVDTNYISQMISDIYGIDNVEVCNRRASTVKKWLLWVDGNKL